MCWHKYGVSCSLHLVIYRSALWLYDPTYPELIHPMASAIDTELPPAPERVHVMLGSKPKWVPVGKITEKDEEFDKYPNVSLADWHEQHGFKYNK